MNNEADPPAVLFATFWVTTNNSGSQWLVMKVGPWERRFAIPQELPELGAYIVANMDSNND